MDTMTDDTRVRIWLLGEVEVSADGRIVDVGHARQRSVLAVLLAGGRGRTTGDQLVHRVWGEHPPPRARHVLHSYLSRLRRLLAAAKVATIPRARDGYWIEVDPASVDLYRFRDALDRARTAATDTDREQLLAEALRQWRGECAFADLDTPWLAELRETLARERYEAQAAHNDLLLNRGEGARLLPELVAAADAHPLDERLAGQLMRALYDCGRQAEALDRYRRTRQSLIDELGTEPGPALRDLHQQILTGKLLPRNAAGADRTTATKVSVPRQMPAPPPRFVGREADLAMLTAALAPAGQRPAGTVVICGMGGVGKTTLALHWAHQNLAAYPDGQLYVNLRGFDPAAPPLEPSAVIRSFLAAMGLSPEGDPTDLEAQAARYRTVVAPRRMLVLLDNARDADQVRPLLPGAGACRTLITSRDDLTGLIATEDAHAVPLYPFTPDEAYELLSVRLGGARTANEPDAVARIIDSCGRLPLALAVVAGQAAVRPTLPLSLLADELTGPRTLDVLTTGDRVADVRRAFAGSYRAVSATAARVFRLLGGVHPGPDLDLPATVALVGLPVPAVRRALTELLRTHLLNEPAPGRYALHDLLRTYAAEQAGAEDIAVTRAATRRMIDHYLGLALAASFALSPHREQVPGLSVPRDLPPFADPPAATDWFGREYGALRAMVDIAAAEGFDTHAWQLAWAMTNYFDHSGRWHDWAETQATGVAAAVRDGNRAAEAHLLRGQGRLHTRLLRFAQAHAHLRRALRLFRQLGDPIGEARTDLELGWLADRQGAFTRALRHDTQALRLFRAAGHRVGQARALHAVGWDSTQLGRHHAALRACRQALALQEALGVEHDAAASWDSIGQINHRLGHHDRAIACYQRSLALRIRLGDRHNQALVLDHLGDAQYAAGCWVGAERTYRAADEIYADLCLAPPPRPVPDADATRPERDPGGADQS